VPTDIERLQAIIDEIIGSGAPRKVIVAGAGTGKTTLFRKLLQAHDYPVDERLVLTFNNFLKAELEESLGGFARVMTCHGYCRHLLHSRSQLRGGLSGVFHYFPPLNSLIETDWKIIRKQSVPEFVDLMRRLESGAATTFFLDRANKYDAVSFDDSVFRIHQALTANTGEIDTYKTVLIDEYQDFNKLEASLLSLLATRSPIVIVGDDDQSLYIQLRDSSPEHIRARYAESEYAHFALPFCMRCTDVIVRAVGDIVAAAQRRSLFTGRIDKPYLPYPPSKAADSAHYPKIKVVETSVQKLTANYFGRYVAQQIDLIPPEEIHESHAGKYPTVLIIGPKQYLKQVRKHLEDSSYQCLANVENEPIAVNRNDGLKILHDRPEDNLGWRIVLEIDKPSFMAKSIRDSVTDDNPLSVVLPDDFRENIIAEANAYIDTVESTPQSTSIDQSRPLVKFTSFEGSKGLSAQHVFVVGLHEGDLPRNSAAITDLEVSKFIVAITRTRKQCHLIHSKRWGAGWKHSSPFLSWIRPERREDIKVNRDYWPAPRIS